MTTRTKILAGVVIFFGLGILAQQDSGMEEDPPAVQAEPDTVADGVRRVGVDRAAQLYQEIETMPGIYRLSCGERLCTVQFDPRVWFQLPADEREDLVAGVGIALAYGRGARWTEFRNSMDRKRMARYSSNTDHVTID